jgi:hypothetical protein
MLTGENVRGAATKAHPTNLGLLFRTKALDTTIDRRPRTKLMEDRRQPLSDVEIRRLQRLERTRANKRGRKNPAAVPARLARTSAFAPKRRNLITDSKFRRTYIVPGHSYIEVAGRELGSQHRDALYAVFRLKPHRVQVPNPEFNVRLPAHYPGNGRTLAIYETQTTWRELVKTLGLSEHPNNLLTLLTVFEELQTVVIRVQDGDPAEIQEANRRGMLSGPGIQGNIIDSISWDGVNLDSCITVRYGEWVREMIEKTRLVSLNAEVQFALASDHAKSFWPYIDSMTDHSYVDEVMLAALAGRDLWAEHETSATRAQFRKDCRQAFQDMVKAGGLQSFRIEVTGTGRKKGRRYHYIHALPRRIELNLKLHPT